MGAGAIVTVRSLTGTWDSLGAGTGSHAVIATASLRAPGFRS